MLITVSGPAGSGKSTLAANLAEKFSYEHISGGDIFRDIAAERDLTPLELNKLAEEEDQIDRDLDRRLRSIAQERDNLVLESRLAGWMAPNTPICGSGWTRHRRSVPGGSPTARTNLSTRRGKKPRHAQRVKRADTKRTTASISTI